ncbi:MAG: polyamine aminopropyltransferase [Hydrogenobaculum sp.]|jgi:spermidine synthase|uniref:polyamine aminopropyltransferase n=1 Tax=unclassified Hydrogenobaculum TaxID=2622382 RepID=UPI0001C506CF|nr:MULTISPECIES: polyamine aminopropyltransferase [unclassified Hydrogenobaculum]AEF19267.1 spermidine synthase [Hydrogenobaculum sp. 3684]AEG46556.1 Spermidine synthase [Hydrogenobaculum sp. SHO]AGG15201.1 spermidine synthase [Hydrogenobaculum sp. HO]AGH93499.1 spermidine synthase [Hydrogenobaculum sp. SN]
MKDVYFMERDPYAPIRHCYGISKILYEGKSKYQEIQVVESHYFGKMLILDGVVQFTEKNEFFYHEMLTHPVMFAHKNPQNVLIIGGGDGGILREVLKHKSVKKAVLVDIDKDVVEVSKKFFPTVACSMDDPRAIILNEDGFKYIQDYKNEFDVIIVDSTDPVGFAHVLTTEEFFKYVFEALKEDGIYVGQSESLHYHLDIVVRFQKALKKNFPIVDLYTTVIPVYAGYWWSFSVGSKVYNPREISREVDVETRFYSDEIHKNAFLPPNFYQKILNGNFKY